MALTAARAAFFDGQIVEHAAGGAQTAAENNKQDGCAALDPQVALLGQQPTCTA